MKKIKGIILALLLTITLVACTPKVNVEVELSNISKERVAIQFDLKYKDPKNQLEGEIVLQLFDGDTKRSEKKLDRNKKEDFESIRFTALLPNTYYDLKVLGTIKGKSYELYTKKLNTQLAKETEIYSIEDFFNINKDRYAKYKLMVDLDFKDYKGDERIANFYGEFDGNNKTIKNFKLDNSSIYNGLFGQVGSSAVIKNLVVDSFEIGSNKAQSVSGTKYAGVLIGRSSSASVEIENITIRNSKINYDISSTSENIHIGMLAGTIAGKVKNIKIEDNNEINVKVNKFRNINIGGTFGRVEEKANINKVINDGKINVTINQTSDYIRTNNYQEIAIGGFIGRNFSDNVEEAITNTDILIKDITYNSPKLETSNKNKTFNYNLVIGGLIGRTSRNLNDAIYEGKIEINQTKENEYAEDVTIIEEYSIGGLIGIFGGYEESLDKLVIKDSVIEINILNKEDINVSKLLAKHPRIDIELKELSTLVSNGNVNINIDSFDEVTEIDDLSNFFENEWILNNL